MVLPTTRCLLLLPWVISRLRRPAREWLALSILVRILLPLVHLLLKLFRLLLIRKAQPEHAFFTLEAEEEDTILVVLEGIVDLLVPDHTAVGRSDIHKFDPEGITNQVVGQDGGALEASVGPS